MNRFPFCNWWYIVLDEHHNHKTFSTYARFEWLTDGMFISQVVEMYFHDDFENSINMN